MESNLMFEIKHEKVISLLPKAKYLTSQLIIYSKSIKSVRVNIKFNMSRNLFKISFKVVTLRSKYEFISSFN